MTIANGPSDSTLLPALLACLDGMLASDTMPEGLMRGEIGWLGDGLSDPDRESAAVRKAQTRNEALSLANTARGLLDALENSGEGTIGRGAPVESCPGRCGFTYRGGHA